MLLHYQSAQSHPNSWTVWLEASNVDYTTFLRAGFPSSARFLPHPSPIQILLSERGSTAIAQSATSPINHLLSAIPAFFVNLECLRRGSPQVFQCAKTQDTPPQSMRLSYLAFALVNILSFWARYEIPFCFQEYALSRCSPHRFRAL